MQKYARQISYSYLSFKDLIKISVLSKDERALIQQSRIIKLREGQGVTCCVNISGTFRDQMIESVSYAISIADHVHIAV